MKMQTLGERNTYTPPNVPQVQKALSSVCDCDFVLNKDPRMQETVFRS